MHKYGIGSHLKGHPEPVQEGCTMLYDESGPMLLISLGGLTEQETKKLRKGLMEFAVFEKDEILFLLVQVPGVLVWSDAPFHIGLYPDGRQLPDEDIKDGEGWGLNVIGLEATTGEIKALRLIGLGTEISREMFRIIVPRGLLPERSMTKRLMPYIGSTVATKWSKRP